jgi:hypothetical protein
MASGIYGRRNLAATTLTTLVANTAVAANAIAIMTVNLQNAGTANTTCSIALTPNTSATFEELVAEGAMLEYLTPLGVSGVLERTGIIVPTGFGIVVRSAAANVQAIAYGIES